MTLPRREILRATCAGAVLGLGALAQGCGPKRRTRYLTPPGGNETPAPQGEPPAAAPPPPPTEGRLVSGEWAARGLPQRFEEPLAPPGRWVARSGFWLWLPLGWESVLDAVGYELATALPRWEPNQPALDPRPGPDWNTRVVLIPGPTFADPQHGAVAGVLRRGLWPDGSDVIWLGLTDAATRRLSERMLALEYLTPERSIARTYSRYCPAAEHELAHQWSGQDGHPWE